MKKRFKLLIVFFFFVILLAGSSYSDSIKTPTEDEFHEMVENLKEAVVTVKIKYMEFNVGIGSGMIYKKEASPNQMYYYYVVTNQHVVESATSVELLIGKSGFEIGDVYASGASNTSSEDIAVIRFESSKEYKVIEISTPTNILNPLRLSVGQKVFAIGSPVDVYYSNAVSDIGIVTKQTMNFIVHTSNINPGNSGGPLFAMDGSFIGINTQKVEVIDGRVIDGIGEAISIDRVKFMIQERLNAVTPKLGINITTSENFLKINGNDFGQQGAGFIPALLIPALIDGVVVMDVASTRPSHNKLKMYDLITGINGVSIKTQEELALQLGTIKVGNQYNFEVYRKEPGDLVHKKINVVVTI